MNQTREEFLRRHAEHAQRLDDLAGELQTLDLSEISHKVGDFTVNLVTEILAVFQITHFCWYTSVWCTNLYVAEEGTCSDG